MFKHDTQFDETEFLLLAILAHGCDYMYVPYNIIVFIMDLCYYSLHLSITIQLVSSVTSYWIYIIMISFCEIISAAFQTS